MVYVHTVVIIFKIKMHQCLPPVETGWSQFQPAVSLSYAGISGESRTSGCGKCRPLYV